MLHLDIMVEPDLPVLSINLITNFWPLLITVSNTSLTRYVMWHFCSGKTQVKNCVNTVHHFGHPCIRRKNSVRDLCREVKQKFLFMREGNNGLHS